MAEMKPSSDPYRVLGVSRGADLDQIKTAHRQLAKRFHPDGSTGDEKRFLAVQEAYQLLADPLRRREWDLRHAPGPVRASAGASARSGAAGAGRPGPGGAATRRTSPGSAAPGEASRAPREQGQDRRSGGHTWSAERVPWWEDFSPRSGAARDGRSAGTQGSAGGAEPGDPAVGGDGHSEGFDFDVFNRSSGAAWSMAARRHFRRGEADLPSRGAWRYRGTQVVTGAEARKVAAEEAAAEAAARNVERQRRANEEAPFRRRSRERAAERQAFDHEPPGGVEPARRPAPRSAPAADERSRSLGETLSGYFRSRRGGARDGPEPRRGGGRER